MGSQKNMISMVTVVAIIGLAKPYIDSETKKHIAYAERRSIIGNFSQYEFEFGKLF